MRLLFSILLVVLLAACQPFPSTTGTYSSGKWKNIYAGSPELAGIKSDDEFNQVTYFFWDGRNKVVTFSPEGKITKQWWWPQIQPGNAEWYGVDFSYGSDPTFQKHADPRKPSPTLNTYLPYIGTFGEKPDSYSLESIFLSLPNELAADMPVAGRKLFIEQTKSEGKSYPRFDPAHQFVDYYSDADDGTGATSMLSIKVLPSRKYGCIVFIHMPKPTARLSCPANKNTYILVPNGSQWRDATNEFLPKNIGRDWYFNPLRTRNIVEAGRYVLKERRDNRGMLFDNEVKLYDLRWKNDHFVAIASKNNKFTYIY